MARLARVKQIIFGSTGLVGTGGFGAAAIGNVATGVATGTTLATIMGTAAWAAGWLSAVLGGSKFPPLEDVNAVEYALSTQIAYLLQQGIPEYDATTTYWLDNIVVNPGTFQLYGSKTDNNTGNALNSAANWQLLVDLSTIGAGNPIYTGGTSTGSANAQVVASLSPTGFTLTNGYTITFTAGFSNSGATTMNANATGATAVRKNSGAGPVACTGGEIVAGNTISMTYNSAGGYYVITNSGGLLASNNLSDVQSLATSLTNLGGVPTARTITAAGLVTGGGDLSANRTVTVTAAVAADQRTATSNTVAVTPGVQQYHPSAGKGWVNFNGTSGAVRSSYNVSSVTRNGTGDYTANFTNALTDANYAVNGSSGNQSAGSANVVNIVPYNLATGTCRVQFMNGGNGGLYDNPHVSLQFMGNQ